MHKYNIKFVSLINSKNEENLHFKFNNNKSKNDFSKLIYHYICYITCLTFIFYIVKQYEYYPFTIIDETGYSYLIRKIMGIYNIKYEKCRFQNHKLYYKILNNEKYNLPNKISFNSPCNFNFRNYKPIFNDLEKIKELEKHTSLDNLFLIQKSIQNNIRLDKNLNKSVKNFNELENHNIIIYINKLSKYLSLIKTNNKIWLTNFILNDNTYPLKSNDDIISIYGIKEKPLFPDKKTNNNDIFEGSKNYKSINYDDNSVLYLTKKISYHVDDNLNVYSNFDNNFDYDKFKQKYIYESNIYHLSIPRFFTYKNIYYLHPFHLPFSWDIFITFSTIIFGLYFKLLNFKNPTNFKNKMKL